MFFNAKGNPSMIVKNDKDFCLVAVKNYQKLLLGTIEKIMNEDVLALTTSLVN